MAMTDEERRQLVARFRAHEVVMWTDIDLAADELEQLADRVNSLETVAAMNLKQGEKLAAENDRLAKRLEELEQRDRDIANDIRALARWI